MERTELQGKVESAFKESSRLILQFATGVGKSKIALDLAAQLAENCPSFRILLVVAEVAHKENWKNEFVKWKYEGLFEKTDIITYASLKKVAGNSYDLVVYDEIHHLATETRLAYAVEVHSTRTLGLSATVGRERFNLLKELYPDFRLMNYSLSKAIDSGILPDPDIYAVPMELDNKIQDCEIVKTRGLKPKRIIVQCNFEERWTWLKNPMFPNLELHIKCTQRQKYEDINDSFEFWKNKFMRCRQEFARNKWMLAGTERKRFLGELKTSTVSQFIKEIMPGKRFICFCTSIEQQLALAGKDNYINSKEKKPQITIDRFNSKKIDSLYCVGMLQEGQNLTDTPYGIIVQLDNETRRFIQKTGRLLRADNPVIYIFYYKDTRDEEFLNKVREMLPDKIKDL